MESVGEPFAESVGLAGEQVGGPVELDGTAGLIVSDAEELAGLAAGLGAVDIRGDLLEDRRGLVIRGPVEPGLEHALADGERERLALGEPRAQDAGELGWHGRAGDPP